jgi:hypothetical protein
MKTPVAIVLFLVLAAGVVAANGIAQTPVTSPTTTTPTGAPGAASLATVQNIVEITRAVPAGPVAVDAFTVPAGVMLVITDIVVTNTGTAAACGGAVNRAGGTPTASPSPAVAPEPTATTPTPPAVNTAPTTTTEPTTSPATGVTAPTASVSATGATAATSLGTLTQTDSTVTGPLCVPAQTTTTLPLTTGIEFGSGQVVQLLNAPAATAPTAPAGAPSSLAFHLRGVLITSS